MPTNGSSGSGCFNKKILCISDFGFPGSHEEKICRIPVSSFMISFQRNASMKKNSFLKHPVARRISHRAGFPNADERSLRVRDAEVRLRPSRGWSAAPVCPFVEMLLWTASDCSKGSACQKIRAFCQVGTAEQPRDGPRFSM